MSYGRDYDFSTPFFKQFIELQKAVPRASLYRENFISSDYCNYGRDFKECYLLFGGANNERVYFGNQIFDSRDSLDIAFSEKLEFSYENFECSRTNKLFFSHHCQDCVENSYLIDCRNCMNCFGCIGLVNKQYHIWNVSHTKEEYNNFLKEREGSYAKHLESLKKLHELDLTLPHRYARIYKSINSDGDDLSEARNTHYSYSSRQTEDSKYLFFIRNNVKDCYNNTFQGFNSELCYETAHSFGGNNTAFGVRNFDNRDAFYNEECHNCSDIFGCEGLRKKSYCILNKQYSKEEYEELKEQIIQNMKNTDEWGLFFPKELSPFCYNEAIVNEYMPLTKEEALAQGFRWKDNIPGTKGQGTIEYPKLPKIPEDYNDNLIKEVLTCESCEKNYKLINREINFYKKNKLSLPSKCFNCRHALRMGKRNVRDLWNGKCAKCKTEIRTSYKPEDQLKYQIFCEKCYQQEIY
ncbi:hypothetical protein A3G53_00150 [Candidatus Nomurabacteria bacterium RIFCSPLOWO2_12_FULL_44_11]|uniref:Uncharacterized protein n=1 Tax=Candidatus Nomurabacteria bacterium RIFCSPLOWO2_12_FULL_44_11 TaxID=1801796 RepID=A0A1F6Y521_9BACT|nr:MAG: hypothetical protein A3G53_00150 [Candidatus Nomurabacteria bacterium RIFCSPLOWO2_12_FULL_44_11]